MGEVVVRIRDPESVTGGSVPASHPAASMTGTKSIRFAELQSLSL